MKAACISNISVGYGTPQIIFLLRSLAAYVSDPGRPLLIETDQTERPPRGYLFPDLDVRRITTFAHPYSRIGAIRYITQAADLLNREKPDVLLIPSTYCLPVLWKLTYRPALVIYYVLEMPDAFGFTREEHRLNLYAKDKIDLTLYPEPNRARIHIDAFGYHNIPSVIVYNAIPFSNEPPLPSARRNGRILYQGTIHEELTSGDYFLDDDVQKLPIDLYGIIDTQDNEFREALTHGRGNVRYCGYIDNNALRAVRRAYQFSIVFWNPLNDNQRYACPNKFFESIADGVPPISAPHPQCKLLTQRYDLGLMMRDWELESFVDSLRDAASAMGTPEYEQLVQNCERAHGQELNWEVQFEKVRTMLDQMHIMNRRNSAVA
jgi:glycosyltransferase involved in cell wall biosynthesis